MDHPPTHIRDLEELSLNAWPGLKTVCLDGWVLRFADRYTRRANSVNPLYPSRHQGDLLEKIAYCETLYAQTLGQDVVFKMTDAAEPGRLDTVLAERGYSHEADTSVLTLDLGDCSAPDITSRQVIVSPNPSEEWLAACCELANVQTFLCRVGLFREVFVLVSRQEGTGNSAIKGRGYRRQLLAATVQKMLALANRVGCGDRQPSSPLTVPGGGFRETTVYDYHVVPLYKQGQKTPHREATLAPCGRPSGGAGGPPG